MYITVKRANTKKLVKAEDYEELLRKVQAAFKDLQADSYELLFDPEGENYVVDTEDVFDYLKQQESVSKDPDYKLTIYLQDKEEEAKMLNDSIVSGYSVAEQILKPVSGDTMILGDKKVIFSDRSTMSTGLYKNVNS